MKIQLNEREIKRLMQNQVQSALNDMAAEYTRDLQNLAQRMKGRPVEEIKPMVRRIFQRNGGGLLDREVADYAALISEGTTITVKADQIRL